MDTLEAEPPEVIAEGCVCDRCTPSCSMRPFYPCCGACMADSGFESDETPAEFWDGYKTRHPEEFAVNA